jgi:peptidoglycan/LPS O-acetylase OafA/YrhL
MLLTGLSVPILDMADLGVDLFIFLSGFLMVFQYEVRKNKEDWSLPTTWGTFWARRFFRLSPLYFVLLACALVAGKSIYADRLIIDHFLHSPPQQSIRYTDTSIANIVVHVTYIFGILPSYSFRTPLPDWSLGLEMQFYAAFPFIVIMARRFGWIRTSIFICLTGILISFVLALMNVVYPMPSFLPLKIHIFASGMLIASANGKLKAPYLILSAVLTSVPIGGSTGILHIIFREVILVVFFALIHYRSLKPIEWLSKILESGPFQWLGELSYGVYLIHLLLLHRVVAWSIAQWGYNISSLHRFSIVFIVVAPIVYGLSCVTYFSVERPGQGLGKRLIKLVGLRRQAAQVRAEEIAAP